MTKVNDSPVPQPYEQRDGDLTNTVQTQGVSPDKLLFRFMCQWCGLRCCMASGVETVTFLPYSMAYILQTIPHEVIQYNFGTQMLKWECPSTSLPFIRIDFFVCPFLLFHFDNQMKDHYLYLLLKEKDHLEPNFQLFLTYLLHALTTKYFDYLKDTNQAAQDDPIMGLPAHALISEATSVWQQLTTEHPDLFVDETEQDFTLNMFEFIRDIDGEKLLLRGSCNIYSARPSVSRVHPLARITVPDTNGNYSSNLATQKVIMNQHFCPPSAFEQGEEITATQYLEQQDVHFYEYTFLAHVNETLYRCKEILERLNAKAITAYYQALLKVLYFTKILKNWSKVLLQNQLLPFSQSLSSG